MPKTALDAVGWEWTRQPVDLVSPTATTLTWSCGSDSDFWRITAEGATKHDGYAYLREIEGDFELRGRFDLDLGTRFDHAGFILIADQERWLKAAYELEGGEILVGAVHTRGDSDWSCGPAALPGTIQVTRKAGTIEVRTLEAPERWRMIRQLYLTGPVRLGPFSAAPTGSGYTARLTNFSLTTGA
jgi:regulation of enolase protein 1 (concanavalin A-like superfamily)